MFGYMVHFTNSHEVWSILEKFFTTQSHKLQLRFQLQSIKKGFMTVNDYILKMKAIAENLSAAVQLISDEEPILYILGGVDQKYDPVVINLISRCDEVTLQEVQFMVQS